MAEDAVLYTLSTHKLFYWFIVSCSLWFFINKKNLFLLPISFRSGNELDAYFDNMKESSLQNKQCSFMLEEGEIYLLGIKILLW